MIDTKMITLRKYCEKHPLTINQLLPNLLLSLFKQKADKHMGFFFHNETQLIHAQCLSH